MDRKTLERISILVTGAAVLYFLVPLIRIYGFAGLIGMVLALATALIAFVVWLKVRS